MSTETAYWIRADGQSNAWLYRPGTFPEQRRGDLQRQGWQRVRSAARLAHYCGQLVGVRQTVHQGEVEYWVDALDYNRPPVSLGLTLPQWARELIGEDEPIIHVANPLPPPQIGEIALIETSQDQWQLYTLTQLGDEALDLWRRLGSALKTLSAPAEWWPVTPLLMACLEGHHDQLRSLLRGNFQRAMGEERLKLRAQLAALEQATKRARLLRLSREYAQQRAASVQAQWRQIQELFHQLALCYWEYHRKPENRAISRIAASQEAAPLLPGASGEGEEDPDLLTQILPSAPPLDWFWTPSFPEDRLIREALLAPSQWKRGASVREYTPRTGDLAVYFLDRDHPMPLEDVLAQLLRVREGMVLTIRIVLSLWYLRKQTQPEFCRKDGTAGMTYDEILLWHGRAKHGRAAYPGAAMQYTDGFTRKDREAVRKNLELARLLCVRGSHRVIRAGCEETINVDDPYLLVSFVSRQVSAGPEELLGVFAGPGPWITSYMGADKAYLAVIGRQVLKLHPQNDQHEIKIALFLMERWMLQSADQNYAEPISMQQLLQGSVIHIENRNLTNRFAPRIEEALKNLHRRGIIGSYKCLKPVDKEQTGYWGKRWLASMWRILPPKEVARSYANQQRPQLLLGTPEPPAE